MPNPTSMSMCKWALVLAASLTLPTWAGELKGEVQILVNPVPARAVGKKRVTMASKYGARAAEDAKVPDNEDEARYVVVQVYGEGLRSTPKKVDLVQKNKQFLPHVLAIPVGSSVRFVNEDDFEHNVYSVSEPGSFDTGKYQGKYKSQVFKEASVVEIFCGLHPRMNAYIFVCPNDAFDQPDEKHRYSIPNLPAGKYRVRAWHPRLKTVESTVDVPASGAVTLDFKFKE